MLDCNDDANRLKGLQTESKCQNWHLARTQGLTHMCTRVCAHTHMPCLSEKGTQRPKWHSDTLPIF